MLCQGSRQRKIYLRGGGSKRSPISVNLDHCRSLPSFRRFVEEDVAGRAKLLLDDEAFARELDSRLDELDVATARFSRMSGALYGLTADLPGAPLGRQLYSVYRLCLVRSVGETHEYREAFDLLAHLSPANLQHKLQKFVQCLQEGELSVLYRTLIQLLTSFLFTHTNSYS